VYSESSSPLDENASNTIASTLASLGLGDDSQTSEPFFEPVTRHRVYTVNAKTIETPKPVGFGAFVPHKFSPALKQRPRAISLGRSDTPVLSGTSFAPFDMSYSNHHPRNDFSLDHPLRCSQLSQRFDDTPIVDGENDEIQVIRLFLKMLYFKIKKGSRRQFQSRTTCPNTLARTLVRKHNVIT
jgi:hypothetical protein